MTAHFDITSLWQQAHPHLTPLREHLPLADMQTGATNSSFSVLAHLDFFDPNQGFRRYERAQIICHKASAVADTTPPVQTPRYSLAPDTWAQACTSLNLPLGTPPIAVNARLWSAEPTFLNIEPTTRCNFACWYCVGRHMEQADITPETFASVLDHFPTVKAIALVGEGEPLMHKGFFEMAQLARDRGIRVLTLSNGSTFSSSNVAKICEAGISYISISIDSIRPEEFASSRIEGRLEQVLTGIRRLADYRDQNGYKYPRIGLKGTLFTHTENELPEIAQMAKAYGADIFESFQPLNPMVTYVPIYPTHHLKQLNEVGRVAHAINRDTARAHQLLQPVADFCEQENIRLDKNGTQNGVRPNCDEEWIYTLLSGDITPCCQIKTPPSPNWNLAKRPLIDILSDADYENMRFNLYNGLFPDYCRGCWKTRT